MPDGEAPGTVWLGASLTPAGLERTDVLAVHSQSRAMIEVQVKTIRAGNWMLGRGSEPARSGREWYIFVKLGHHPGRQRATSSRVSTWRQVRGSHIGRG
jgi:hypothetical protein